MSPNLTKDKPVTQATNPNPAPNAQQPGRLQQLLREKLGMPPPAATDTPQMALAAVAKRLAASLDVPAATINDTIALRMAEQMKHAVAAVDAAKEAAAAITKARGVHEAALATARLHVAAVLGDDFRVS